jgi:hypothetical protein
VRLAVAVPSVAVPVVERPVQEPQLRLGGVEAEERERGAEIFKAGGARRRVRADAHLHRVCVSFPLRRLLGPQIEASPMRKDHHAVS